jgi:hypothetical protein
MRMVIVLFTAMVLMASITGAWYITLPIVITFSRTMSLISTDPNVLSHINLVEIVEFAWGPAFDAGILIWIYLSATRKDVGSEYVGYD